MLPKILIALSTLMVLIGCGGSSEKAAPPPTTAPAPSPSPVPSSGLQFYVSTSGLDSNPGSQSSPWATIQHAAIVAAPGDTVHVASGTYSATVKTTTSG
jgi:hypothetical protein